jgi:hypothetical protein
MRLYSSEMRNVCGWQCKCGFGTVRPREQDLDVGRTLVCYACKRLYENGGVECKTCHGPLTRLCAPGNFVDPEPDEEARAYWSEYLFEHLLRERFWLREHPKPPFPRDARFAPPGWTRTTEQTRAYDDWFSGMQLSWAENKPLALADVELVAQVRRHIAPMVDERVAATTRGERQYKRPRCGNMTLTYRALLLTKVY